MIIQLGALFGSAISGLGTILGTTFQAAAPTLLQAGNQFLQRELQRKLGREQQQQIKAQAVQVLNTPGISVARLGGTTQPVGGRVQRAVFTSATTAPAQSPIGNIPLLPVGFGLPPLGGGGFMARAAGRALDRTRGPEMPVLPAIPGPTQRLSGASGPRFAQDSRGDSIKFVPSPDGNGFIMLVQAQQLGLRPTRPFWRFNRFTGMYEKIKGRRMNPFNFKAASRAGRRIDATLDAVKEFVRIEKKMSSGKISLKRRKKRK